jgi:hypothetical protein
MYNTDEKLLLYCSRVLLWPTFFSPTEIFAILNGGSKRRIIFADLVSPREKPAENTRHLTWRRGGTLRVRFGLAHFSNGLWFFDDFSKLT